MHFSTDSQKSPAAPTQLIVGPSSSQSDAQGSERPKAMLVPTPNPARQAASETPLRSSAADGKSKRPTEKTHNSHVKASAGWMIRPTSCKQRNSRSARPPACPANRRSTGLGRNDDEKAGTLRLTTPRTPRNPCQPYIPVATGGENRLTAKPQPLRIRLHNSTELNESPDGGELGSYQGSIEFWNYGHIIHAEIIRRKLGRSGWQIRNQ